jgi:hypothetical protein
MIERIVDELKALPVVPADAAARVLARVDAARRGERQGADAIDDDDVIYFPAATDEMPAVPAAVGRPALVGTPAAGARGAGGLRRRFVVSLPAAIGYALAATMAGFLIRGALPRDSRGAVAESTSSAVVADSPSAPMTPALTPVASASRAAQEMPVPVQFVLDARRAKRVALVGDFNAWDGRAHPLTRDSASGVWSTVVRVAPGRHVYAFLVDDSVWTLDPRAPRAKDADYGAEQSVLIVGVR